MRFVLGAIAIALLLGMAPAAAEEVGEPGGEACTEIGCQSGLFLKLGPAKRAFPKTKKMRLCVDARCRTFKRLGDPEWIGVVATGRLGSTARVSMTLFGKRGKVLRKQTIEAPVTTERPNGEDCPPVCYYVQAELNGKGRLVPLAT